jgi:hypothetical protein
MQYTVRRADFGQEFSGQREYSILGGRKENLLEKFVFILSVESAFVGQKNAIYSIDVDPLLENRIEYDLFHPQSIIYLYVE